MEYLYDQYQTVKQALECGHSLSDVLAIKEYVQKLMAQQIAEFLSPAGTALEVGCGGSLTLHYLSAMGRRCTGVDTDPECLAYSRLLRRHFKSDVELVKADARKLPFEDASFEYVYSVGLIEHYQIETQRDICRELARVSNRYVHIEIPNPHPLSNFWTVGQASKETHYPCNPGILFKELGLDLVVVDGRCVFNSLSKLSLNPPLLNFAVRAGNNSLRETYSGADVSVLVDAEKSLSRMERLVYGFQLCWIGKR